MTRRLSGLLLVAMLAAGTAMAATSSEFYTTMLRRGIADFNAGRFEAAAKELEIAAFGMLDAVEQFQTAQVYLAIANDRLGHEADARRAAQRVLAAERLQQRFAALSIPQEVRTGFANVTRKILTSEEQASLGLGPRPQSVPPPQTAAAGPTTTSTIPAPRSPEATSGDTPAPASISPATPAKPAQPTAGRNEPATTPSPAAGTAITVPFDAPASRTPKNAPATVPSTNVSKTTTAPAQRPPATATRQPNPPATAPASQAPPAAAASSQKQKHGTVAHLQEAERAIAANDLPAARAAFAEILTMPLLDRAVLLRVAEGTYRARDFRNTVSVFARLGDLRAGEEPYGFYLAVALYETGDYAAAKRTLARALPYIESTPLVERYRLKIEGAAR